MQGPLVSVITNVRNGAATLGEAIDSVLAQTFTDWELIIWDNRSTDGSEKVAAAYTDPRIRYFRSSDDIQLSQARAAAIAEARGEWIAFLDHDDIWMPRKLEQQMAVAGDENVGLIYGRAVAFFENGYERDFDHRHEFELLPEGDIFETLFVDSCFLVMSSAVIRRRALEELGPTPEAIHISPDYYYYTFVAKRYQARAVQDVVCRYRIHSGGLTNFSHRRLNYEVLWILDQFENDLPPRLLRWRRQVHNSLIAVQDLRELPTFTTGLRRLLRAGSVLYVLSRPFARSFRAVRRRIQTPYWKRSDAIRSARGGTFASVANL